MNIQLIPSNDGLKDIAFPLIQAFWECHNQYTQEFEETLKDYEDWTKEGHLLYLVKLDGVYVGFAHLGNRGANIDWLEDLFVLPEYQNKGIGSQTITLLEEEVKKYSESLYIEVAARNLNAMKLYRRMGYDCLNTITIRKDFHPEEFTALSNENIAGMDFEIRKYIEK